MDLYHSSVKPLPAVDRLRLALLILNDITPAELAGARQARRDEPVEVGLGDQALAMIEPVRQGDAPA